MQDLATFLLGQRILTEKDLDEARNAQAVYGGRLGTNLVQLGFFQLEELAPLLSRALEVPLPPPEWLDDPDPAALKLIPMPLVRRCKLLPLKLEKKQIHVVMLDPQDPKQLDFVATASDREVVPYVLPELRLLHLLEFHLAIDRHPRFVNVTTAAARSRNAESKTLSPGGGSGHANAPTVSSESPDAESEDAFELLLEDVVTESAEEAPRPAFGAAAAVSVATPASVDSLETARLESRLEVAADRGEAVDIALQLARIHCQVAAIFLVTKGIVHGFRAVGEGLNGPLSAIQLPVATESIFARPVLTLKPFRGAPPTDGIDGRLLDTLGRSEAQEVLVQPVTLRGRVVSLLYADNASAPFAETSAAALAAISPILSRAYESLIVRMRG